MQRQRALLTLLFLFLSACSFVPQITPDASVHIVVRPSATASVVPSLTPTITPTTVLPSPTADPNFFREDFVEALDTGWTWLRQDPLNWSLTAVPGALQINVGGGYVAAHTNSNLLLRTAPAGDFQIETQVTFRPEDNYQFAGLIIYESDSNFIQAGRGYCRSIGCAGEGLYMNFYKNGKAVKPDFGQEYKEIDPILLRLSRQGETYLFEASTDGKVWFIIGSHTADFKPLQMGLVTGQRMQGSNLPADFEYFEVRSLP